MKLKLLDASLSLVVIQGNQINNLPVSVASGEVLRELMSLKMRYGPLKTMPINIKIGQEDRGLPLAVAKSSPAA